MKISIDLNNIQTKSFEESEFLHQDSRDKFIKIIEKNINLISDDSCNRVHRSILNLEIILNKSILKNKNLNV